MHNIYSNLFVFVACITVQIVLGEINDKRIEKADTALVSLPINSKFWNPQLDDKTNMKLIGIQYFDDSNKTIADISDKSSQFSRTSNISAHEKNWTGDFLTRFNRRGERYFIWGLLNLLKPWTNGLQDASLRNHIKILKESNRAAEK